MFLIFNNIYSIHTVGLRIFKLSAIYSIEINVGCSVLGFWQIGI